MAFSQLKKTDISEVAGAKAVLLVLLVLGLFQHLYLKLNCEIANHLNWPSWREDDGSDPYLCRYPRNAAWLCYWVQWASHQHYPCPSPRPAQRTLGCGGSCIWHKVILSSCHKLFSIESQTKYIFITSGSLSKQVQCEISWYPRAVLKMNGNGP